MEPAPSWVPPAALRTPPVPSAPQTPLYLTMIQSVEGTWDRVWELSEVTEGTPAHHSREKSQGALTV